MNPDIFRQYDIRGIAATDLTDEVVTNLGRAFATRAHRTLGGKPKVGVGYDMRTSSTRLRDALTAGLTELGCDVVDLGMVPTPLVYFAKFTTDIDACIQITGSHNPGEYNGFKMVMGEDTLHGDAIQSLRSTIESGDYAPHGASVVSSNPNLIDDYDAWVRENLDLGPRKLKVILDCGNGIAGVCAPALIQSLGFETISLFPEPDGDFPNHHPDPTVEKNLQDLISAVAEHGADLGIAYDGDGDRIGVVNEKGEVIWGDKLMIILSRSVLKSHPGATIIGEVKCSQTLFDDIFANGGDPIMSKVGHSLIKAKIKETSAKLAGEMSGHIFFNDRFFGFDDAIYTTGRLLEILSHTDQPLSALLADVPLTFATPEIRFDCAESIKFDVPGKVAAVFADDYEVNRIDGARINFGDGWGLVRASNTQPVLVLRVEANTAERRDAILAQLRIAVEEAVQ